MRLEARFDGGLDLLDAADEFLDRGAGGGIEERDARSSAGGATASSALASTTAVDRARMAER